MNTPDTKARYLAEQLNEIRAILAAYEAGDLGREEALEGIDEVLWSGRVRREMAIE